MYDLSSAVVCSICRMIYILRLDFSKDSARFVLTQIMLWTYVITL